MKQLAILLSILLFSGCSTVGVKKSYTKFFNTTQTNPYKEFYNSTPPIDDVILLNEGEESEVFLLDYISSTSNPSSLMEGINRVDDLKATLESNGYVPIGYSLFNSGFNKDRKSLTKAANELGATVAVATSQKSGSNSRYVPVTSTTNHSGTVGDSSYSGTSTTQSSKVVTTNTYDHYAIFYAKAINPRKNFGVILRRLNDTEKKIHSRNTGAVISGVGEKSPAFYANLVKGQVITKVNDQEVLDVSMAMDFIKKAIDNDTIKITINLYGEFDKNIYVKMNR